MIAEFYRPVGLGIAGAIILLALYLIATDLINVIEEKK